MNIKWTNTSIGCQYDPTRAQPSHFEDQNECANHAAMMEVDKLMKRGRFLVQGLNIVTLKIESLVEDTVITLVLDDHVVHDWKCDYP